MDNSDEPKSSRAFFLRLLRRKLRRELDGMGYPGGHTEGTAGSHSGGQTAVVIDAGEGIDRRERTPVSKRALQR